MWYHHRKWHLLWWSLHHWRPYFSAYAPFPSTHTVQNVTWKRECTPSPTFNNHRNIFVLFTSVKQSQSGRAGQNIIYCSAMANSQGILHIWLPSNPTLGVGMSLETRMEAKSLSVCPRPAVLDDHMGYQHGRMYFASQNTNSVALMIVVIVLPPSSNWVTHIAGLYLCPNDDDYCDWVLARRQ